MGSKFTRRRFLTAVGASATCLALANTLGCQQAKRTSKTRSTTTSQPAQPEGAVTYGSPSSSKRGVWAFRSRPDLSPPAVKITKKAHDTAPGYIFVAPEEGDAGQGGSMILDNDGQPVWLHLLQNEDMDVMNFRAQTYKGETVLTWWEGYYTGHGQSEYVIFDDSYYEIARFTAANGYNGDHHEFLISPQDTALIAIYEAVPWDLSYIGGARRGVVWQCIVQELDIQTGEVLFEWRSIDHVALEETYVTPLQDGRPGIDYFHLNSIDVDDDDNLLISARETSTVYKIDRNSGKIIWRLGGKRSDFEMGPGTRFAFQHDARRLPDGTISIFDNGSLIFESGTPKAVEESRGIVLGLDESKMKATLVREYTHPDKQYADAAGNMQVLPNGNVFVGWGRALVISEFSEDGQMLFDASLPRKNESYRAFRFPWSARPSDQPAAVAERVSEQEVLVYASWNGATEVATWEVLAARHQGRLESLGVVPRNGFETAMVVRTSDPYVAVRAKDRSGQVLGTSKILRPGS
jgi:outer membrane protein assembly factor BamB